ncbi:hypothetical protein BKA70DRAFT_1230017 [Coprinopsis sp. MPI-PUGE-AT-0042]|nr:hypothetical protein BKA70DRAFT_1230017 [Coprinopsis sp. MPI-PUGE-AT-0042]
MLRSLELNFATRYPPFVVLRNMLENGCPHLESLIIRDDLDAALRLIKPPPCPYLDEGEMVIRDCKRSAGMNNSTGGHITHPDSLADPFGSSSSSDTTVDRPIRTAKYKVELTPIRLVALKHLEIGLHRPQANCKQASSTTPARFLHLFSTPRLASFVITNIRWAEWVTFADVVGLPEDPTSFIQDGRGLREGSGTRGASSTYPLLQHLDINFCD